MPSGRNQAALGGNGWDQGAGGVSGGNAEVGYCSREQGGCTRTMYLAAFTACNFNLEHYRPLCGVSEVMYSGRGDLRASIFLQGCLIEECV